MKYNDTIYYSDELHDEFSGIVRKEKNIGDNYKYISKNPLWNFVAVIVHRIFVTPAAFIYCKAKFRMKIKNKHLLKGIKGGYYLYGNHTQVPGDGFLQAMIAFPKKSYAVVNSDSMAVFGTENLMKMIGAFPLPSNMKGYRNFQSAMQVRSKKSVITIFPEAHIWPYYTKVRPFPDTSFRYPIKDDKPTFCFSVTYQKRKNSNKANMTIYIDGPFFADESKSIKEQTKQLRDMVYNKMSGNCKKYSDYEFIKYIHRGHQND